MHYSPNIRFFQKQKIGVRITKQVKSNYKALPVGRKHMLSCEALIRFIQF